MKITLYANIYSRSLAGSRGSVYATEEIADQMAGPGRIACVEFTFDPEGDDDADENGDPERAA